MFKRGIFAVSGVLILAIFVLSTDAHAIPFKGNAWVAHHLEVKDDYFFVIDPKSIDIDPNSVKLKGYKIKQSSEELDFSDLTEENPLLWFKIKKFKPKKGYEFSFKDTKKNKYNGEAKFKAFHNPGEPLAAVPEPATILLIGSGLLGLAGIGRKKFKKIK